MRLKETSSIIRLKLVIVKHLPLAIQRKLPKEIVVVSVTSRNSGRLNLIYRNKRQPANVLSFRYGPDYGEILVCPEVIRREAKKQGNPYKYQMTWMIVHGILHLAELHHERSGKTAERVEALEEQILRKLFS